MVSVNVDIKFNPSFYEKLTDSNWRNVQESTIKTLSDELLEECKNECPVDTGSLRDGHYTVVNGLSASICNIMEYAPYVIYGTSRQAANNYPERAMNKILTSDNISSVYNSNKIQ